MFNRNCINTTNDIKAEEIRQEVASSLIKAKPPKDNITIEEQKNLDKS